MYENENGHVLIFFDHPLLLWAVLHKIKSHFITSNNKYIELESVSNGAIFSIWWNQNYTSLASNPLWLFRFIYFIRIPNKTIDEKKILK